MKELDLPVTYGWDGVSPFVLKEFVETLEISTRRLFMISLEEGCAPTEWKRANVIK